MSHPNVRVISRRYRLRLAAACAFSLLTAFNVLVFCGGCREVDPDGHVIYNPSHGR